MTAVNPPNKPLKFLGLLAALALGIRILFWQFYLTPHCAVSFFAPFYFPDSVQYFDYGKSLADAGAYILPNNLQAWRAPLAPLIIAALSKINFFAGADLTIYRAFGITLDLVNLFLGWTIARKLFNDRAALMTAALFAIYPAMIFLSPLILSDTPALTAILLVVYLAQKLWREKFAYRAAAVLGIAFAIAALIKASFGLLFVVFIPLFALKFFSRYASDESISRWKILFSFGVMMLFFALGMSGWIYRNYHAFGQFIPFSTMAGFTWWESSGINADGGANNGRVEFPKIWQTLMTRLENSRAGKVSDIARDHEFLPGGKVRLPLPVSGEIILPADLPLEIAADRYLRAATFSILRADFSRALKLSAQKFIRTWSPLPHWEYARRWYWSLPIALLYGGVAFLALLAAVIFRTAPRRAEIYILYLPVIYLAMVHSVFMGSLRYRMPVEGCLIILATGAIDYWWTRISARKNLE